MVTRRRIALLAMALVLVVVGALVVRKVWQDAHRTGLEDAVRVVPKSTMRLAFTDWAAVRERLGVPDQDDPSPATIEKLTSKGYDTDLTAASVHENSAYST